MVYASTNDWEYVFAFSTLPRDHNNLCCPKQRPHIRYNLVENETRAFFSAEKHKHTQLESSRDSFSSSLLVVCVSTSLCIVLAGYFNFTAPQNLSLMVVAPSRSFCHLRPLLSRRTYGRSPLSSWVPVKNRSHAIRRRPLINGQVVPFHISELHQQAPQPKFLNSQAARCAGSLSQEFQRQSYESDLVVVLDLDECLLHSKFTEGYEATLAYQVQPPEGEESTQPTVPLHTFKVQLPVPSKDVFAHVNLRPGALDFLRHVTSTYETHIFTAAMPVYANPVLDHLSSSISSSNDVFAARWFREDCTWDDGHQVFVKDLSKLPLPLHKTVLVDNNPFSFLPQPDNGIWVNSFFADGNDATLQAVQTLLQEDLHDVDDVRPVLAERFQLATQLDILSSSSTNIPVPPLKQSAA